FEPVDDAIEKPHDEAREVVDVFDGIELRHRPFRTPYFGQPLQGMDGDRTDGDGDFNARHPYYCLDGNRSVKVRRDRAAGAQSAPSVRAQQRSPLGTVPIVR